MNQHIDSEARVAPGILGYTLLSNELKHSKTRPAPASSGCTALDTLALDGGFRYGEITSIASAKSMGKSLIALHTIASHLIRSERSEVAFIDTTGSFSPARLRDVLLSQIEHHSGQTKYQQTGYIYERIPQPPVVPAQEALSKAVSMLDRVRIMRVFDFVGLVEAVAEIRDLWDRHTQIMEHRHLERAATNRIDIADSENEDDEGEVNRSERQVNAEPPTEMTAPLIAASGVGMIVIDTITNVISSIMTRNQTQGQALLAIFTRSLRHLTTRYHICALLINSVVGLNPPSNPSYQTHHEDDVSMFSSTVGKPALGKLYTYLIDTSVFISSVPRTRRDTETVDDGDEGLTSSNGALVLEVLKDRHTSREGQWCAFEMVTGIELQPLRNTKRLHDH